MLDIMRAGKCATSPPSNVQARCPSVPKLKLVHKGGCCGKRSRVLTVPHATDESKQASLSEDVLARLRAAEEETERLRKQLAAVQGDAKDLDVLGGKSKRIDGADLRRETLFTVDTKRRNWLSEADVDFVMGENVAAPSNNTPSSSGSSDTDVASAAEQQIVQRRLLIGGLLTAGAAAFALVPTDMLSPPPSKPLFFYLVPVLRAQDLLQDCKAIIDEAQWQQLSAALSRISGQPNNLRENLYSAAALLQNGSQRAKAEGIAQELVEYITQMDYNKYFDAMPSQAVTGAQNAKFVEFSSGALKAAQAKLVEFLAVMPRDQLEAARTQLSASF